MKKYIEFHEYNSQDSVGENYDSHMTDKESLINIPCQYLIRVKENELFHGKLSVNLIQ